MNNYPYFNNNMYMQDLQNMRDRIDRQMAQMQQPQNQQTPAINQTFQLSNPQNNINDFDGKYANNIDDVKNTLAIKNTLFINKEMNSLWLKDATGKIKSYSLQEIIEKDEKDIEIDKLKTQNEQNNQTILELQKEINDLKGVVLNAKSNNIDVDEPATKQKSTNVSNDKYSKK